ncbi:MULTISPECIES: DUF2298 domain-containing protein [Caldilinea]|uniref:YYY membrane protein n=1 Tax=Caldilinea aerophila (strain DSM 14535 / JCM 11387 / NBRC 104270 / STL-6-O1) TaxID=926550 RepID=I0I741_CALAS|nr:MULTISPECIES: DUF2298 domain-containing protein [Caldilinea]MBO9392075.1 hypothetical protein [Caldilinea sp.]BAM01079.1 hypothetical protein CLDAP_30390 [Caldilinea aerophila DSM 14535 = NBRC 104270]GIV72417.1 MAG: hypothetical protein KatS3mg049_0973 [Caldilinea sp.]
MALVGQFFAVYLVVQVMAAAALPLALRFFAALPDRGYAFSRLLGILLTGYCFWIAYSLGLLRNDIGGAWLALIGVAIISVVAGRRKPGALAFSALPSLRYILLFELLFLGAFAAWAWVRAHDPAADHTEQPMDLMFMHSIRASLTYPPHDAWLAGYPISYYYFGYWLMNMVGLMAGQSAAVAYNLSQAVWFGLLLSGAFGIGYNLVAAAGRRFVAALGGGWVATLLVGLSSNLQGLLEWLHANGVDISWLAAWLQVRGFPENAEVTRQWFISYGWWWWRSSRVLADVSLRGDHIEVIDEFPAFSYILGDNHPHVAAMPFAMLAVAAALVIFLQNSSSNFSSESRAKFNFAPLFPLGWGGFLLVAVITGSLLFLNTWDYPPYWLLTTFSIAVGVVGGVVRVKNFLPLQFLPLLPPLLQTTIAGLALFVAALLLYLPYLLTAQSQVGGLIPNLFHPTRFSQYVAMFATALLTLTALLTFGWSVFRPRLKVVMICLALTLGTPALLLTFIAWVATGTEEGRASLGNVALPDGASSYLPFIVERWTAQPFTFLIVGAMTAVALALLWTGIQHMVGAKNFLPQHFSPQQGALDSTPGVAAPTPLLFVLALAVIGLGLTFTPEVVYLRDNFGWRMNTIFKFYYQAWLLFGLAGAFTIVDSLSHWRGWRIAPATLSMVALILALSSTIYLIAGAYSKTQGFSRPPTFDASAYLASVAPAEYGAVEWVRANTLPTDIVVEGKGRSYGADTNRISTMTGRPTLLGWDGHESQWRGRAYGRMAAGRPEALQAIYGGSSPDEALRLLKTFGASYLYVGPWERAQYGLSPTAERMLYARLELVYEDGASPDTMVRIYRVP